MKSIAPRLICATLACVLLGLPSMAVAANSLHPHLPALRPFKNPLLVPVVLNPASAVATVDDVRNLSEKISQRYPVLLQPLSGAAPACDSDDLFDYTTALSLKGRFRDCLDLVKSCADNSGLKTPAVLVAGGFCAGALPNEKAETWILQAVDPRFAGNPDEPGAILAAAQKMMVLGDEKKATDLLNLNPDWSEQDRRMWIASIRQVLQRSLPLGINKDEVDQFLTQQLQILKGRSLQTVRTLWILNAFDDDRHGDVILKLIQWLPEMTNADSMSTYAYSSAYIALNLQFASARLIYDAWVPFTNWFNSLPVEENTLNYSQIRIQCANHLVQAGPEQTSFENLKQGLRNGSLNATPALVRIQKLLRVQPHRADLLTLQGSLLSTLNRHEEAIQSYWSAHQECPYYNRAHWGLSLEKRNKVETEAPQYNENVARVAEALPKLTVPSVAVLKSYFVNWDVTQTPENQKLILYDARIWLPWLKSLANADMHSYLKLPYELLSEAPGMADMADTRITYANDNRLWDDTRGTGGPFVIADLIEALQTTQGAYNLLGHEMTHQFHVYIEQAAPPLAQCVEALYAAAQKRGDFPEAYAGSNFREYFAQGVTYYLVPEDAPTFGLNRSWYRQHDPALLQFIESIDQSKGNLSKIRCPISTSTATSI